MYSVSRLTFTYFGFICNTQQQQCTVIVWHITRILKALRITCNIGRHVLLPCYVISCLPNCGNDYVFRVLECFILRAEIPQEHIQVYTSMHAWRHVQMAVNVAIPCPPTIRTYFSTLYYEWFVVMGSDPNTCSSKICHLSCWVNTDCVNANWTNTNEHLPMRILPDFDFG